MRFRMRTALLAIGILASYFGWEKSAWRTWRLRENYLRHAGAAASHENVVELLLQQKLAELAALMQKDPSRLSDLHWPGEGVYRSKAGRAAALVAKRDRLRRETRYLSATIAAYAERRRKYERASADPWRSVEPDSPLPESELDADDWLRDRQYTNALAAYDELARIYPDLVEAHSASAWIRATCPAARYRDGKLAISSAT